MRATRDLKTVQERTVKALSLRPKVGQGTATTRVRARGAGTACDISDGDWSLVADMGEGDGGEGLGPDPGVFVRAGLGACLAIGYRMWAARLDVALDTVEVTVEADYDARGMYAVDDAISPGWGAVRVTVEINSAAGDNRVREVVEQADRHSPILDDLSRAMTISRDLRIVHTE